MMKRVHYNAQTRIVTAITLKFDSTVISEEQYAAAFPNPYIEVNDAMDVAPGYTLNEDGETFTAPPPPVPDLDALRAEQIAKIDVDCQAHIAQGFVSNALGAPYTYPSAPADQLNMASSVLGSLMPNLPADWTTPFKCADANGVWDYRMHTASQIQQAGQDGKAAVTAALVRFNQLSEQVKAADTPEAIAAIEWSAP